MRSILKLTKIFAASIVAISICGGLAAQEAQVPSADNPLATSLLNNGWAEAALVGARRDGDSLHVSVRFKAAEGVSGNEILYSGFSTRMWETDFYIVADDKKYLIMKDSSDKPLAPSVLKLSSDEPQAGSWSATFPAPPTGAQATLYMLDVEPLGPFTVPE